jgi:TolB protein
MTTFVSIVLVMITIRVWSQELSPSQRLQEAIHLMETKGDYPAAVALFEQVAEGKDRQAAAQALFYLGDFFESTGKEIARQKFLRLVTEFPEQAKLVESARKRLATLDAGSGGPAFRRLLADENAMGLGAPSKNAQHVALVDWGLWNLHLVDLRTQQRRRLTNNPDPPRDMPDHSVISPDGARIAYTWIPREAPCELRLANVEGGEPRVLWRGTDREWLAPTDWSVDGGFLLGKWLRNDRAWHIVRLSLETDELTTLQRLDRSSPGGVFLSPDGRFCAYDVAQHEGSRNHDVYVIGTDGADARPTRLAAHTAHDMVLGWMPDGRRLVFSSDRSGTLDLWVIDVRDGKPSGAPTRVQREIGHLTPSMIAQNGALFFERRTGSQDVFIATLDADTGKVTGAPVPVTQRFVGSSLCGAWSPDGKSLAYYSDRGRLHGRTRMLAIRTLETGDERELQPKLNWANHIRLSWSPDGRSLLISGKDAADQWGVFRCDAETGAVTPLFHADGNVMNTMWSKDGTAIFHNGLDGTKPPTGRVVRRHLLTGLETEVYRCAPGDGLKFFDLSPDGQTLATLGYEEGGNASVLRLVPVAGGQARILYRTQNPIWMQTVAWSADGKFVFCDRASASATSPSKPHLWRVAVATGEAEALGLEVGVMPHVRAHPDGERLVFHAGEFGAPELWVLEHFLPPVTSDP